MSAYLNPSAAVLAWRTCCIPRPKRKYIVKIPREKEIIIIMRSLRRPELDITEAARKTRIPRRQGLNPARRPAAKTVIIVDKVILPRSISPLP